MFQCKPTEPEKRGVLLYKKKINCIECIDSETSRSGVNSFNLYTLYLFHTIVSVADICVYREVAYITMSSSRLVWSCREVCNLLKQHEKQVCIVIKES